MPRPDIKTNPALDAGKMDRRVTLLRPVYNQWQDEITGWEAVTKVWADINPSTQREITMSNRSVSVTLIPITIRYRSDIDARWRVQDRGHVYEIQSMADIASRHVALELTCQEVS